MKWLFKLFRLHKKKKSFHLCEGKFPNQCFHLTLLLYAEAVVYGNVTQTWIVPQICAVPCNVELIVYANNTENIYSQQRLYILKLVHGNCWNGQCYICVLCVCDERFGNTSIVPLWLGMKPDFSIRSGLIDWTKALADTFLTLAYTCCRCAAQIVCEWPEYMMLHGGGMDTGGACHLFRRLFLKKK